jgi:hypothetical protein
MNNNNQTRQFTANAVETVRQVRLYDTGDRDQGGQVIYKAGEPKGGTPDQMFEGRVQALAPYKGEWLCQVVEEGSPHLGKLCRVHSNKITGNEHLYKDKVRTAKASVPGAPAAKAIASENPIQKWQRLRRECEEGKALVAALEKAVAEAQEEVQVLAKLATQELEAAELEEMAG